MSEETTTPSMAVATIPASGDLQLTAIKPDEIAQSQLALIEWSKRKIIEMEAEATELEAAYRRAVTVKWKSEPLKRLWDKSLKRVEFYKKMLTALEHGFVIIPNFPVTVFAIRTERGKPMKMLTTHWGTTHEQKPEGLDAGEGEYKNPFPEVWQKSYSNLQAQPGQAKEYKEYWAENWKEMEFPLVMAKANIMEVTSRAMALKVFDDFGIMPERKREDPIIVARLKDPRSTKYQPRVVTFMVAWYLNTKLL